jgi:hypothetical protein
MTRRAVAIVGILKIVHILLPFAAKAEKQTNSNEIRPDRLQATAIAAGENWGKKLLHAAAAGNKRQ